MTKKVLLAMLSFSIMVGSAQASKLVVMGVNLNGAAPAGQKTYTIGMDTEGAAGFLAVGNIVFTGTGAGGSPKQANFDGVVGAGNNRSSRQAVEAPATNSANNLQYDSWWYVSGGDPGLLKDADDNIDTTDPIVGATGFLWQPQATGITCGGTTTGPQFGSGSDMGFTGSYGPFPTSVPAGIYPLLQVRTSGDVQIGFGAGTKLSVQTQGGEIPTNVLGGDQLVNPGAFLSFSQDKIVAPEPSSFVLAGLGLVALVGLARRRRR